MSASLTDKLFWPVIAVATLALCGMGWSFSHLSTPLIMGFLADRYGIVEAFYAVGVLALACAIAIAFMRRWAFGRP